MSDQSPRSASAASAASTVLSWRILAALLIGLTLGAVLGGNRATGVDTMLLVAAPIGRLWLDALTMTVVPLVFALLVTGVSAAAESASAGGVARRAVLWFTLLLVASTLLTALVCVTLLGFWPVAAQASSLGSPGETVPAMASASEWVAGFIPTNPIKAAADTAMVPLVVFALIFGFAVTRIDPALRRMLIDFFRAIVETMLVIVHWVLWLAPIGVLALAFTVGARLGVGAAGTLIQYVVVVATSCLAAAVLSATVAIVVGRLSPVAFARAALPVQIVAVSTQSSLASLPAMIEAAPALGVERSAAGVVLPLAVSLFRASSAAANMAVAIYLGHLHGVEMGPGLLIVGALTAAVVSLAAVGLPAQVSFFATIGPVCIAMGVPLVLLPVMLAVETIPDIFRTLGNVTADLAVTRLAGRGSAPALPDQAS
jgi:proton glutamate symport protein